MVVKSISDLVLAKLAAWYAVLAIEVAIVKGLMRLTMYKLFYLFAFQIPGLKHHLVEQMSKDNQMEETGLRVEQWQDTITTFKAWQSACRSYILDMRKKAKLFGPVVSAQVVKMDRSTCDIGDFQKPGRPLVVFFGSCS